MKAFRVTGSFADARAGQQPFTIEMAAADDVAVKEKALSTLGSKHKLKRWEIKIVEIVEIPADQITNATVRYDVTGE